MNSLVTSHIAAASAAFGIFEGNIHRAASKIQLPTLSHLTEPESSAIIAVDGARFVCRTIGKRPPLLVLNGFGATSAHWDPSFVDKLASRNKLVLFYFVDTPEEERIYADRVAEQAAYFGISPDRAVEIGREASEFTRQALSKPFTIYTRWRVR